MISEIGDLETVQAARGSRGPTPTRFLDGVLSTSPLTVAHLDEYKASIRAGLQIARAFSRASAERAVFEGQQMLSIRRRWSQLTTSPARETSISELTVKKGCLPPKHSSFRDSQYA